MLKKPLPGPARLMLGAGLAVLASSAGAAALWQQQPATIVSLPAVAVAAATAPLPPLAVDGRLPAPAPSAAPSVAVATATVAPVVAPAAAGAVDSPAPVVAPAPAAGVETVAPKAEVREPVDSPAPASARARTASAGATLTPPLPAATRAAPLAAPLTAERIFLYSENQPLPPPPMPKGELEKPETKVVLIPGANPGAAAADYQPPTIRRAKPARLPVLASVNPDSLVVAGMVMKVRLDATGKPVDVAVHDSKLSGVYERNALAAVKRWRFEPARSGGRAVESAVLVPVWFEGTSVSNFESEAMRHPRPQYRAPPQMVAGQ